LLLNCLLTLFYKVRGYFFPNFLDDSRLVFQQWRAPLSFPAACTKASIEVTDEVFGHYVITDQYIIDCNHKAKVLKRRRRRLRLRKRKKFLYFPANRHIELIRVGEVRKDQEESRCFLYFCPYKFDTLYKAAL